jgi:hypothetical protein
MLRSKRAWSALEQRANATEQVTRDTVVIQQDSAIMQFEERLGIVSIRNRVNPDVEEPFSPAVCVRVPLIAPDETKKVNIAKSCQTAASCRTVHDHGKWIEPLSQVGQKACLVQHHGQDTKGAHRNHSSRRGLCKSSSSSRDWRCSTGPAAGRLRLRGGIPAANRAR